MTNDDEQPQGRPMDGTGTLIQRGPDGQPLDSYFGGAHVHGGYWVQLVDSWPHGRLQAQLDRIESKLDLIGRELGLVEPLPESGFTQHAGRRP